MSTHKNVAFRVDASRDIGTGHFMRCLALAAVLSKAGSHVRFLSRHAPEHLRDQARADGHEFIALDSAAVEPIDELAHSRWLGTSQRADAKDSSAALAGSGWDWLIVDHYALDERWETTLRASAKRIMAIDDLADRRHDCDLLLDQNLYLDADARYASKTPPGCRLLLGPRYALLREEFGRLHQSAKPRDGQVRRVLVFFGGVDAGDETGAALAAIASQGLKELRVDVVIGARHARRAEIEAACTTHGFTCHVQTARMADLMAAADLAVGAGGSASWERCCLGLPALTLPVADNQKRLVEDAALSGLLYAPRPGALADQLRALLGNPLLLSAMSRSGLRAVDGRGTRRVLRALGVTGVAVREATAQDSARLFSWRNHPTVRAVSASTVEIERPAHEAWLAGTLTDPDRVLLIGERDGEEMGVVRFDVHDGAAEVSIHLAPELAGSGCGGELLAAAELWLADRRPDVRVLDALVLRDNQRSRGLFEAAGYRPSSTCYSKNLARP